MSLRGAQERTQIQTPTIVTTAEQGQKRRVVASCIIALVMSWWAFVTPLFQISSIQGINGYNVFGAIDNHALWPVLAAGVVILLQTTIAAVIVALICIALKSSKLLIVVTVYVIIQFIMMFFYFCGSMFAFLYFDDPNAAFVPWLTGSGIVVCYFLIPCLAARKHN